VRRIAMNLRPATLDSLGISTMSWHLREIEAVCPDLTLERNISVEEADVPIFLKTAIFRILQEASSNAIKHAGANRVKVSLGKKRGILELVVEDNGQGSTRREFRVAMNRPRAWTAKHEGAGAALLWHL